MALHQAQSISVSEFLASGQGRQKVKANNTGMRFQDTFSSFSAEYNQQRQVGGVSERKDFSAPGNNRPSGGNSLPGRSDRIADAHAPGKRDSSPGSGVSANSEYAPRARLSDVDSRSDTVSSVSDSELSAKASSEDSIDDEGINLSEELESLGLDQNELKKLILEKTELSEAEFDRLAESPEQFMAELENWLQDDELGAEILALMDNPMAFQQLLQMTQNVSVNQSKDTGQVKESSAYSGDKNEGKGSSMANLVDKLLSGKQADQEAMEENLSKEKLMEQIMTARVGARIDSGSGFSSVFSGEVSSLNGALSGITSATGNIPQSAQNSGGHQLPVLRGLPGQPGATEALSERIMMMRSKNMQIAEIKLDPQELGALEVRVKVVNDVANIQFHSPNQGVREALESQIVKLREMMDESGLTLGDVGVSDQSLSEQPDEHFADSGVFSDSGNSGASLTDEESVQNTSMHIQRHQALGLVDYFA
ncbi:flagellar hook-length control protein FliK [Oceanospirillum sediminis]|uniref:Flagellar hook-length control protein FliK n=1 Tax=Oceanospirillum sediminis TaxID=2760088 RepID=A0A839IMC2_9GAMM|nr:flagellar hook-length control protein FliK [Oceanospirillum sediminis]MBB1485659.1 flagellar hook-length control protein FliK [Oceanospirillum sediminis]